jgi:hypothetical protein
LTGVDILGGASGFDPKNNVQWLQFATNAGVISLYGIDINTGRTLFTVPDTLNLETLAYDPLTQLMYGIGLKVVNSTTYYRVLLSLNSKTGDMEVIGAF